MKKFVIETMTENVDSARIHSRARLLPRKTAMLAMTWMMPMSRLIPMRMPATIRATSSSESPPASPSTLATAARTLPQSVKVLATSQAWKMRSTRTRAAPMRVCSGRLLHSVRATSETVCDWL